MKKYKVLKSARADLRDIGAYTERTWGRKQRSDYLARLTRRFEDAASRPHLGRKCDHIREGYLSVREGRHIIFYQKRSNWIEIAHVVHESRNIEQALGFRQQSPNKNKSTGIAR